MKKLNKLLALLLALAMVFCLAACAASEDDDDDDGKKSNKGNKETTASVEEKEEELSDEEKVVGEWVYKADLSDALAEELAASMDESLIPNSAFNMNIIFAFEKNGDMTITFELDKKSVDAYMAELADTMVEYMYDAAEAQGMSKTDFEKAIKDQYGMTVEKYVESQLETSIEGTFDDVSQSMNGYYKLDAKKGRIYVGETKGELESEAEYAEYSFSGDNLKLTDFVEDGESAGALGLEIYGIEMPWTFEKQ